MFFIIVQAESAELESQKTDVGWTKTEGDPSSLHYHCSGMEKRWLQGYLCKQRIFTVYNVFS